MAEPKASSPAPGAVSRPLSPHLQVWKWHVTMATSIFHRMTGVGNALGTLLFTWWIVSAAVGPEAYATFQAALGTWLGQLVLLGFTVSLSYHLLNGIRHLVWDTGRGFALGTSRVSGIFVFIGTVVLTAVIWFGGYSMMGVGQ